MAICMICVRCPSRPMQPISPTVRDCHGSPISMESQSVSITGLNGPWRGAQRHPYHTRPGCQRRAPARDSAPNCPAKHQMPAGSPRGGGGALARATQVASGDWRQLPVAAHSTFRLPPTFEPGPRIPLSVVLTTPRVTAPHSRDVRNESTRRARGGRTTVGILHSFLCKVHGDSRVGQPCLCDGHARFVHDHRRKPCLQLEGANR